MDSDAASLSNFPAKGFGLEKHGDRRGDSKYPLSSTIFTTRSTPRWENDDVIPLIGASSDEAAPILVVRLSGRGVGRAAAGGSGASGSRGAAYH